jgi:hypothetical protein
MKDQELPGEGSGNVESPLPLPQKSESGSPPRQLPWFFRFMDCNPFYLLSALLLVYGLYRIAIEPHLFETELKQLLFSFGSIELYEITLIGAALFLARHKIWYDSTLLVSLENLFLMIPFMLISQAVFLGTAAAWIFVASAFSLVLFRQILTWRGFASLQLPGPLYAVALLFLAANSGIPLIFRHVVERNNETWTWFTPYCWDIALPMLAVLANALPRQMNGVEAHRKSWFQFMVYAFWLAGTAAHLFSLGYVDDQKFRLSNISVLIWVSAWTVCNRLEDFIPSAAVAHRKWFLALPFVFAWMPFLDGREKPFFFLMLLNALIYGIVAFRDRENVLAVRFALASLGLALAALPQQYGITLSAGFSRDKAIAAVLAATLIVQSVRSRSPRWGIVGAITVGLAMGFFLRDKTALGLHWIAQVSSVFYLIHSLHWRGNIEERGARFSICAAGTIWLYDTFALYDLDSSQARIVPLLGASLVFGFFLLQRFLQGLGSILVAICSCLVVATPPTLWVERLVTRASPAVLSLLASFLLLGFGTCYALRKKNAARVATGS